MFGFTRKLVLFALVVLMGLIISSEAGWADFFKPTYKPIYVGAPKIVDTEEAMGIVKKTLVESGIKKYSNIQILKATQQMIAGDVYKFDIKLNIDGKPRACFLVAFYAIAPKPNKFTTSC